jgi:hypothetical protein
MEHVLNDKPALIAMLLAERSTCLDCIGQTMDVSTIEADRCLTVIGTALELHRTDGRCERCGENGTVYSLMRASH